MEGLTVVPYPGPMAWKERAAVLFVMEITEAEMEKAGRRGAVVILMLGWWVGGS